MKEKGNSSPSLLAIKTNSENFWKCLKINFLRLEVPKTRRPQVRSLTGPKCPLNRWSLLENSSSAFPHFFLRKHSYFSIISLRVRSGGNPLPYLHKLIISLVGGWGKGFSIGSALKSKVEGLYSMRPTRWLVIWFKSSPMGHLRKLENNWK